MREISKERAHELAAAWEAASTLERLRMKRMAWIATDTVAYYEEEPSRWEMKVADEVDKMRLEMERLEFFVGYLNGDQEGMAANDWAERSKNTSPPTDQ